MTEIEHEENDKTYQTNSARLASIVKEAWRQVNREY